MADASKRSAQVKKKQMLLLGGIGAVLVALSVGASMMMTPVASKSSPSTQPKTRPLVLGATGAEKESWRAQSSGTISDMERRLNMLETTSKERAREAEDAKTKQRELQTELDRLKTGGGVPPPVQMTDPGNAGVFQQEGLGTPPPPPPALTGPGSMGSPLAPPPTMSRISSVSISDAENNVEADPTTAGEAIGQAIAGTARNATGQKNSRVADGKERFHDDDPLAYNRAGGRSATTYLPAGTFVRAAMINGLDAPTGGQAQSNPNPVLLRLVDNAQLPNAFKADLKDCMITANGHGDLSSERAYIRTDRLSCVDSEGGAIDIAIRGYVSGEDGKTGVRGRLVTKSGQVIANALFTGVLSGLGEGLKQNATATSTSAHTGVQTQDVRNPWAFGVGTGMSKAMDRIVQYYMKLADKLFPVIEVDGGRVVDVIITRGVTIERHTETNNRR